MPHHVVVDGSNLATEVRSSPSLQQLNEAVLAYMAEDPTALITVVVDATFARWGRIQSIRVDDVECEVLEPGAAAANGVGLGLDFRCPKGASLVALSAEDDAVWQS